MPRPTSPCLIALLLGTLCLLAPLAVAEEPAPEKAAVIASAEQAAAALDRFNVDYKARGLKGEEKLSQRDWAMSELARLQHPDIVDALAKISKGSNGTLRILGVIYLGEQTELPGLAGPAILKALKRGAKDPILVLSALQSLGNLRYLGATEELADYLEHRDFAVKKASIQAIGQIGEMRLWKQVLKLAGVEVKTGDDVDSSNDQQSNKEEVVEEGYSYEGVEVTYDTGTAGDGDQKMAEKIGKEKLAANKAAAQKGKGGVGGGGGGSVGSTATGKGGVARDPKELLPFVLRTLWLLTGERFQNSKDVALWVRENRKTIQERVELLDAMEKAQAEEAKSLR